jgi:phosphoglycolate phosphatase
LVDSLDDLTSAVNAARARLGLELLAPEAVRQTVGDGLDLTIARSVPAEHFARAREVFREHYAAHLLDRTRPYRGVPEMLAALREAGARTAVVTNKARAATMRILAGAGLSPYVDFVVSGDEGTLPKPSPEPFRAALAGLGGTPAAALMVGDGRHDILGGRAAGLSVCGVLWGMSCPEELRRLKPDWVVAAPSEVLDGVVLTREK